MKHSSCRVAQNSKLSLQQSTSGTQLGDNWVLQPGSVKYDSTSLFYRPAASPSSSARHSLRRPSAWRVQSGVLSSTEIISTGSYPHKGRDSEPKVGYRWSHVLLITPPQ